MCKLIFISPPGPHGSIQISSASSYPISPPWTRLCDEETTSTSSMLLYLVLSSKRGREGRERRERVRRLWAGELGDCGRYVFVVPTVDTEEDTDNIIEESEEFGDILQTDWKLSDIHAHSKQVPLCHCKDKDIRHK